MKGRTVILDHWKDRETAALVVDGVLEDLLIESDQPRPGTIYRATADRPVKGQGGMFLKTPDGSAFLRQVRGLAPGQSVVVQVTGFAEPGKALPVTQKILFKSRYAIVTPGAPGYNISRAIRDDDERDRLLGIAHDVMDESGDGLILRSSCSGASEDDIAQDIEAMAALAQRIRTDDSDGMETLLEGDGPHVQAWREWTGPADISTVDGGLADHGVLETIDALRTPRVALEAGAFMFVEATRALVAVDVNTGKDISLAAGLKANLACARDLPRALRLRGLGGQIVLDLAPMPKKDRRTFETALRQAFRRDDTETALAGWTPLGNYELQRKRARLPLVEVLG
ncbi:ribonuclease E/G [Roseobacter sp. S98]|uniref:ribonuclease E/G n=1 Tax=Roseobacter algicola (ex Choi et al. 2025) (nom. illeg.) TaxID=3092138 RepID=UPI0035C77768